ncbi:MAG: AI-2E family transporter [Gammaproteobacteria bacterium]|nr:AI-2E family transporter [Gammaproteobacteria bacterium]
MERVRNWLRRQVGNPQVVSLVIIFVFIATVLYLAGNSLAPAIAALVLAYLLDGLVGRLRRMGIPRGISIHAVYLIFVTTLLFAVFRLLPMLFRQLTQLAQQFPSILAKAKEVLMALPARYPDAVSEAAVSQFMSGLTAEIGNMGQILVSYSLSSVLTLFAVIVYLILVPLLVYFMIKDKRQILTWLSRFLPEDRQLTSTVWVEVNKQIGNYVRGKFAEILIVGFVSVVVFKLIGLQYALLLGALTGLSVLIPYIGAAAITLPVALVAFAQWGFNSDFYAAIIAYLIIQALDGNLLAPLLFSEAVDLHPVAIIVAILFFGGVWGFWGLFFAIPLATVIQAVIQAWPGEDVNASFLPDSGSA